jgi:hypothetical protein
MNGRRLFRLARLGEEDASRPHRAAVVKALESDKIRSLLAGNMGMSTSERGIWWRGWYDGCQVKLWH